MKNVQYLFLYRDYRLLHFGFILVFFSLGITSFMYGQDPAFISINHNRLLFNPSLVGTTGSQSWRAAAKSQWYRDGGNGYKTVALMMEETMPCTILDGGFKILANEEGSGVYRTVELGPLMAASLTQLGNQFHDHNIRFGADLSFGFNSIDYEKLIWSDQLHPKDGIKYPTTFVAPNGGRSAWFFNPGFGLSWRSLWNKSSAKAVATNFGVAFYRFWSISDQLTNQSVSVLGLKNPNNIRFTAFAEVEAIPFYFDRQFITIRPGIYYQKQGGIDYFEMGLKTGYTRKANVGIYYHTSLSNEFGQTKWLTLGTDFLIPVGKTKILELNLAMSQNIGGLQNFSGAQFEIGFAYHLAKSSVCNTLKMEDDVPYGNEYRCPIMALTPGKRKMYENIWYKN
ncbi:MAG: type IX secretion system membrane protein PorP/SprF [Saprospiraceae bacterium]|nr:type IX secretion system membrane protein PorP/SprF [Saprospiraceae bacterium]